MRKVIFVYLIKLKFEDEKYEIFTKNTLIDKIIFYIYLNEKELDLNLEDSTLFYKKLNILKWKFHI